MLEGMNTRHKLYKPWELRELMPWAVLAGRSHVTSYTNRESCAS